MGCSESSLPRVAATPPSSNPSGCARWQAQLPKRLGVLARRPTEPVDPRLAAYGDPPVVLRCGAPRDAAYATGAPLVSINGVSWFMRAEANVVVWSTPTLVVGVEARIPKRYTGDLLALLSAATRAAQPF